MLLFALTALATTAAFAVALRARFESRAETLVATGVLFNLLLVAPIYALGLTGHLYRGTLAVASVACSGGTLFVAARAIGPRAQLGQLSAALFAMVQLPYEALRRAWEQRSLVFVGLVFTFGLLVWISIVAWLAPPHPLWDVAWYHEPMIGFAIQNHGFAVIDVPLSFIGLQKSNGYPRLCEMTQLWFALFGSRRLEELPNIIMAIPLMLATYAVASRYSTDRVVATGWAAAVVAMPACSDYLQTAMVDPQAAALVMSALLFSTQLEMRIRDAWFSAASLALAVGAKTLALVPVGILGAVVVARLLNAHFRRRQKGVFPVLVTGTALIGAVGASCYLRNWLHFHNPVWPDLKIDISALHIHWPGALPWGSNQPELSGNRISGNEPFGTLLEHLFSIPYSPMPHALHAYGIGVIWVVMPLCGVATAIASLVWMRSVWARLRGVAAADGERAGNVLLVALPMFCILATSPALYDPRYHVAAVGMMMILIHWLAGRKGWSKIGEGAVTTCLLTTIMMIWWGSWVASPEKVLALARLPYPEREVSSELGSQLLTPVGLAREAELGPGATVVTSDCIFPGLLWNMHYSNRVLYVPSGPEFRQRAERAGAVWIACTDAQCAELRTAGSEWEAIGQVSKTERIFAYHRRPAASLGSPGSRR